MMLQKLVIQTRMIIEENLRNVNSMKFKLESIQVGKSKSLTINKFRIFLFNGRSLYTIRLFVSNSKIDQ